MGIFAWLGKGRKGRAEAGQTQEEAGQPRERAADAGRLLSYQAANLQGVGRRERQEDAFAFVNALDVTEIRRRGLLAVAADGMGGMQGGSFASGRAISVLREDFAGMDYEDSLSGQLEESVLRAGREIFSALGGNGGSTVIVCLLYEERLYFVSVGDSYLYLKRDGQLIRLNREHNVLHRQYLQEIRSGHVCASAVEPDRESAALTGFLGMESLEEMDVLRKPLPLKDGDVLLVCSDGVGGTLSEENLLSCLSEGCSAREMCARIEEGILRADRADQDNYTALVIRCAY
ncbi:MAG: protein phosphatase 2C domain-containing protein [Eubacteriales bacterium]|nr:protein phosphatase 2C domain-containing protein [Eubacteriales bacterium]